MTDWRERYAGKRNTLSGAIGLIPRGRHIFIGSGAAEPVGLVHQLVAEHDRFADNTIVHLMTFGPAPYAQARYGDSFRHNAFFIGANVREAVHEGRADYTPVFLSQIPELMRRRRMPVDVALISVAPPDRFGYVNLGVSVDIVLAAVQCARIVIAEINPQMPTIFGAGFVPMDRIDAWVERSAELPTRADTEIDEVAHAIGRNVAALVEDGSTLQVGIGQIPDAALAALRDTADLGVWSEMLPAGLVDLMRAGNVTGRYTTLESRVAAASFTFGTRDTYAHVDRNPGVAFHPSDRINDPVNIARQHKMVAINAALQIDVTGQVCADSLGTKFYSGIGGQVDFIRGASMCPGGKPIIALRSTAKDGQVSRIVGLLDVGAGVVTSRGDVRFVVTEYGVADLQGKSIRQRALALISIAHPDHRSALLDAAKQRRLVFLDQKKPRDTYATEQERPLQARNGAVLLMRPIRETDEDQLRDLFYSFSQETSYRRWLTAVPAMQHRDLVRYLEVDDVDNVAIVVETQPRSAEREIVGVARYHTDPATGAADVACVVRDDWQRQGIGTAVLEHLADIAQANGVACLSGDVLASNTPMLRLFRKLSRKVELTVGGSTYDVKIPLA